MKSAVSVECRNFTTYLKIRLDCETCSLEFLLLLKVNSCTGQLLKFLRVSISCIGQFQFCFPLLVKFLRSPASSANFLHAPATNIVGSVAGAVSIYLFHFFMSYTRNFLFPAVIFLQILAYVLPLPEYLRDHFRRTFSNLGDALITLESYYVTIFITRFSILAAVR
jgi:hypothetical protein